MLAENGEDCTGLIGGLGCVVNGVQNTVGGAVDTAKFWTDPWGNTFTALQTSARGLAQTVLPTVTHATLPDLNAEWFLRAYAVTFAMAVFVAVALLLPQVLRTARGQQSGRDLVDSLGLFFPLFLVGAMFGPPVGALLVNFFASVSDSIAAWGVTGSASTITERFQTMLNDNDAGGIAGGAPVGVLLMLLMLLGLLIVVVMLVVQLVTLYFTGVLLPLGLVWIIDPTKRQFGTKILGIWLGLLASHPLLFMLLSFAYLMVGSSVDVFGSGNTLQKTVTLLVSLLALFMAGLSPFALMKLAPVLPMGNGGTSAPSLSSPLGPKNLSNADDRYGSPLATADTAASPGATSSPSNASASTADEPGAPRVGLTSLSEAGTESGAETAAVGRGASAGAAGAATAEGTAATAAAAGAAETGTGAGAVVGVPTMIAAGAIAAGTAAKSAADQLGDHVAAPVEEHDEQYGKDRPE